MRKQFLTFLAVILASFSAHADDEGKYRIAAVVNDEVITLMDVQDRLQLIIGTTGLSNTEETRKQLYPRIVRALVEESLQMQEAEANNLRVSDKEIAAAEATIERQRGKEPGSLKTFLAEHGVPMQAFEDQLKAQIAWSKLIQRKIRPRAKISDADVNREIERRRYQKQSVDEIQLSSVLLPVDTPDSEPATKALAEKLLGEVSAGASFEAVAAQIGGQSQNANAIWVNVNDLDPSVADKIKALKPGQISPVMRTPAGYQLVRLINRRSSEASTEDAEVYLKQILMTLKPDAKSQEVDALLDIAREVAKHPGSCADKTVAGMENMEDLNFEVTQIRTKLSAISSELVPIVRPLKVGSVSEPFASKEGIRILMLCERTDLPTPGPDREKIRSEMLSEKLNMEALKYLRNLKREAFVEIRM